MENKINWKNTEEVKIYHREYSKKPEAIAKRIEYRNRPENKARKKRIAQEYNKRPEVKAKRKERRARPRDKAIRKEYDKSDKRKKYNEERYQLPEVKRYHKKYNNNPKTKKRKEIFYEKTKNYICIICGDNALSKYCSRKCLGIGLTGEMSPLWKGGKKNYPAEWNEGFRKNIRDRDNNICMRCRKPREILKVALSVHHIDGNPQNTIKKNCISICTSCHSIVEGSGKKIEVFQPLFEKMLSKLYGYKYTKEAKNDKRK